MRSLKRLLAGLIAGLAALPATRSATLPTDKAIIREGEDEIAREMDMQCVASSRRLNVDYAGLVTGMAWQIEAQKGKLRANACLSGDTEYREFVAARTIET